MGSITRQMAIISGVSCGMDDRGNFSLRFTTYVAEGYAAFQGLVGEALTDFVEAYGVSDVKDLEGKPCWVVVDGGMIKVVGPCVISCK